MLYWSTMYIYRNKHLWVELSWNTLLIIPLRYWCSFKLVIFKHVLLLSSCAYSVELIHRYTARNPPNDKSTLLQVMAWCGEARMLYMNPFWVHDLIKWKHFPRYWPFVGRIHQSPVKRHIYALANWVIIGSSYGVMPDGPKALTNADLDLQWPMISIHCLPNVGHFCPTSRCSPRHTE